MKFTARVLDASGKWTQHEAPGPDCIESWRKCWKVYAVAATMLSIASPASFWYKELLEPALLSEKGSGSIDVPAHKIYVDSSSSAGAAALPPFQKKRGRPRVTDGRGRNQRLVQPRREY